MKTVLVSCWLAIASVASLNTYAGEEQDLVAILKGSDSAAQKWTAAQRLRVAGTAKSIPALAAMLPDERGSQAARHALEGMAIPEASAALRDALGTTSGLLKAGVIESLGWRRDVSAVSLLAPLLSSSELGIAAASASALGRIGGASAATALLAARDNSEETVLPVIREALLKCAERLVAYEDLAGAAAIYRTLFNSAVGTSVRMAAWRGLALTDLPGRVDLFLKALTASDRALQVVALKTLRELKDPAVIEAGRKQWSTLPAEAQLAVLESRLSFGAAALPTVRAAAQSPDAALRTAAWQALGELNDVTAIPALTRAAAQGESAERDAARASLARLRGEDARRGLTKFFEWADVAQKAELLRAFGERGDRTTVGLLLASAASELPPVRGAALHSLTMLAPAEAISPLLEIAAKSASEERRDPVIKALYAVCEASANKAQTARDVVQAVGRFPGPERRQVLPLLAELATPDCLAAAETAARSPDGELAKEAVRVLTQWPNSAPAASLLDLAKTSGEGTLQTLALRGAIAVVGQEPDLGKRMTILQQAFGIARRSDEKKQALGQIGQIPNRDALALATKYLTDTDLRDEACLASIAIAEKLTSSDPKLGDEVASKVLAQVKEGDVARRAWALRIKPSSGASFIRDWLVSGPYRQAGLVGAQAVFGVAFNPEKAGQKVEWKAAPPADHANLAELYPGAENCVAYLRTHLIAPDDVAAVLLMGSDDGIKAWCNGEVVHSNNVDRGQVVDQDPAPIKLKKGVNELMLKVSQGGGGWSACARVVGVDGKPIAGLMVERPLLTPSQP